MPHSRFLNFKCSRTWLFVILLQTGLFFTSYAQVSSFYFRHLTSTEGLSDGVVHDIVQDKFGFIWIATSYGLNRFDGISVKTYFSKPGDITSLTNNLVQSLYVDRNGNLWVGTMKGLCRFDYAANSFVRYNSRSSFVINTIMQDKNGSVWIGADNGLWTVNEKKIILQKFIPSGNEEAKKKFQFSVRQILAGPDNKLYMATLQGIRIVDPRDESISVIRYNPSDKFSLSNDLVYSLSIDSSGYLWAACAYQQSMLNKIDLKNHTIKHYNHFIDPAKKWSTNTIQKILTDKKGRVWVISSYSGLTLYNKEKDDFIDYTPDPLIPNGLMGNSNISIYQDREGIIWLGTPGYGLNYFNPDKNLFYFINPKFETNNLAAETWGRSACEDKEKNLWLGTGRGLTKYDRTSQQFTSISNIDGKKQAIHYNSVRALLKDDNDDIWIGTAQGLNRYHPSTGVMDFFTDKQGMPLTFFWMIDKDKNGTVWFGSTYGLYRYIRKENRFDDLSKDSLLSTCTHKNIQALYVDKHNRLWIGILDVGLVMYDIDKKEKRLLSVKDSLISDTRFSSFAEDKDGVIWIGAENGLTAYDPATNHSHFYTREGGLTSDRTNNIMVDSMNRVWIGTSNGLCMLNAKRDKIKKFDINDGLITNQFNEQSAYRTQDGLFIYPTYKGFLVFKPELYNESPSDVPVFITSFKVSDKQVNPSPETLKDIRLKYDQNFFNIELAGLNYMNPYQYAYAYKLEPFDKNWIFTNKREINYTNVPAGGYVFRYKMITGDADTGVQEKTMHIVIGQIFYKTTWFKLLLLLFIAAGAVAFFRFRLRQREKILVLKNKAQLLEKEKALVQFENLKQQLNPHFLFNSLTSLRSLIRVDTKTATHFLDGLSKTYRYLLKSNDSELVTVEDEINFVQTFVELQKTRFKEGLLINIIVDSSCYKKYIVPVTLQNLIENAIKHNTTSPEQPLQIDIFNEGDHIVVKNNLQRYRVVESSNRRGLASMKTLYGYLSDKPIIIEENKNHFSAKIPLI